MNAPYEKPSAPFFASGPVKKHDGWDVAKLQSALLSRSHRSKEGVDRIQKLIALVYAVLEIPPTHKIALISGSATAAVEAALWNFLGTRGVTNINNDIFSNLWQYDLETELGLAVNTINIPFGDRVCDLNEIPKDQDLVFCLNASTSGTYFKDTLKLKNHEGLIIVDATSAAGCMRIDYTTLDIVCFGMQKGIGAEASFGVMVLSPKAQKHLLNINAQFPMPRLLNLRRATEKIFDGYVINTPSMLNVEEGIQSLTLWKEQFDAAALQGMITKTNENFKTLKKAVHQSKNLKLFVQHNDASPISPLIDIACECYQQKNDPEKKVILSKMRKLLTEKTAVYDFLNHNQQPATIRMWCGPTIKAADLEKAVAWIDWAYSYVCKYEPV